MSQAGEPQCLCIVGCNEAAITRDHGGRHASAVRPGSAKDVGCDGAPDSADPVADTVKLSRWRRSWQRSALPRRDSDRAELLEIRIAVKRVVARNDRPGRRRQNGATRHGPTGAERHVAAIAETNELRRLAWRQPFYGADGDPDPSIPLVGVNFCNDAFK